MTHEYETLTCETLTCATLHERRSHRSHSHMRQSHMRQSYTRHSYMRHSHMRQSHMRHSHAKRRIGLFSWNKGCLHLKEPNIPANRCRQSFSKSPYVSTKENRWIGLFSWNEGCLHLKSPIFRKQIEVKFSKSPMFLPRKIKKNFMQLRRPEKYHALCGHVETDLYIWWHF